jgi:hypothetical protein
MSRNVFLVTSLILNIGLLAVCLFRNKHTGSAANAAVPEEMAQSTPSRALTWSQLESADYPTYIENLRRVGCPELTIREIVRADLNDLFAPKRQALVAKLAGVSSTLEEHNQLESGLRRLSQEQARVFDSLFGIAESAETAQDGLERRPPVRPRRQETQSTTVEMPLVFKPIDTNRLSFSADQIETIDRVRASFTAELGTNQDVNSAEYMHQWQKAQQQADNVLSGMLGVEVFLQYQAATEQLQN